jgi:hypothetical protein
MGRLVGGRSTPDPGLGRVGMPCGLDQSIFGAVLAGVRAGPQACSAFARPGFGRAAT